MTGSLFQIQKANEIIGMFLIAIIILDLYDPDDDDDDDDNDDRFNVGLSSALEQTHCAFVVSSVILND